VLGIFESRGLLKLVKEVKTKLKMLNSSVKLAAEMVAAEGVESGDDSARMDRLKEIAGRCRKRN
jgi:uncharacterized protein YfkK (UPF0435 family)